MRQQIQVTIDQLRAEISNMEHQKKIGISLQAEEQINRDIEDKQTRIAELEEQIKAERDQELESKIEGEGITFNVPGVDFKSLPAELITLIDAVVRADRRRIYAEETEKFDKLIADHKESMRAADERELQAVRQNEILQERVSAVVAERDGVVKKNAELTSEVATLQEENVDLQKRFKNAADQLEESQREISRLNSEIQDMRAAAAFGEKKAQKIIDVTPEETTELQDLVNNLAKKYVAVTPIGGNWHEAVAEDGSKQVVHTNDLPSLETQGSPFRGEDNAIESDSNQLPVAEAPTLGSQFPTTPNVEGVRVPEIGLAADSDHGKILESASGKEPVTQSYLEARLKQFKAEILAEVTGESAA